MSSINRSALNLTASAAYASTMDVGAHREPNDDSRRRAASYFETDRSLQKPNSKRPDGVIVTGNFHDLAKLHIDALAVKSKCKK